MATAAEAKAFLKANGDKEFSIPLTGNEWTAVGALVSMALDAGCNSAWARSARDKILAYQQEHFTEDWPGQVGG